MWSPAVFGRLPANVGSALAAVQRSLLLRIPVPGVRQRAARHRLRDWARIFPGHPNDVGRDDRSHARPVERGI